MLIMVLDHARGFFHVDAPVVNPTALHATTPAVFFTRWITHFCAPIFVALAGAGARLGASRKSDAEIASFLRGRGLLLIVLEFTVVHAGFTFNFAYQDLVAQVLWALGCGMILLSFCVGISTEVALALGLALIASHNGIDALHGALAQRDGLLWATLFSGETIKVAPGLDVHPKYPIVPWTGVMIFGYGVGGVLSRPPAQRRRQLLAIGAALCAGFVVLRLVNGYGDPQPWSAAGGGTRAVMSFLNVEKYPPSLQFLMVTLGPALIALAWLDRKDGGLWSPVLLFGRAPLFYYVAHIFLIHALLVVADVLRRAPWVLERYPAKDWGYGLPIVYGVWLVTVIALYPPCRRIAELKRRRPDLAVLRYF